MTIETGPHDAQDSDSEQDGEGHVHADEGDEMTGESRAHERGEAECPDAGASLSVGHASPPATRLSLRRCCSFLSCALAPSITVGDTCPVGLHGSYLR